MAVHAGRAGQVVVVVDVTIGALARRDRVSASQRESGGTVIEFRIEPGVSTVTESAIRREASGSVARACGIFEIC